MLHGTYNFIKMNLSQASAVFTFQVASAGVGPIEEMLGEGYETEEVAAILALSTISEGRELQVATTLREDSIFHIVGAEEVHLLLVPRDEIEEL